MRCDRMNRVVMYTLSEKLSSTPQGVKYVPVAELAYAPSSKVGAEKHESSSLSGNTTSDSVKTRYFGC